MSTPGSEFGADMGGAEKLRGAGMEESRGTESEETEGKADGESPSERSLRVGEPSMKEEKASSVAMEEAGEAERSGSTARWFKKASGREKKGWGATE